MQNVASPSAVLSKSAPLIWLNVALGIVILVGVLSLWLVLHQPFIGVEFGYTGDGNGILVQNVDKAGVAFGKLKRGDVINAITSGGLPHIELSNLSLKQRLDDFPSFAGLNHFMAHQSGLYERMHSGSFGLLLKDGRRVMLESSPSRSIGSLPKTFWIMQIYEAAFFLIGVGVWGCRRSLMETRLLAIAGLVYMLAIDCQTIITSRELSFHPGLFSFINSASHACYVVYGYSLLLMLGSYPKRLARPSAVYWVGALVVIIQLNYIFQILELPLHIFVFQCFLLITLGFVLGVRQWRITRNDPVSKATFRWFLLSLLLSSSYTLIIIFMPYLIPGYIQPPWILELSALIVYLGLVLGITRYRLFNIDYWWFTIWLWFLSGLLLVAVDLVLSYLFQTNPLTTMGASILLTAWLYFPIRQWLMSFSKSEFIQQPEKFLATILEVFITSPTLELMDKHWEQKIVHLFKPLVVRRVMGNIPKVDLEESGLKMLIPAFSNQSYLELTGMEKGGRLFTSRQVRYIEIVSELAKRSVDWHQNRDQSAFDERKRIARDLHDDVGASLLNLVYTASNLVQKELAQSAFNALRDSMFALKEQQSISLQENLSIWRNEMYKRLDSAGVVLVWSVPELEAEITLSTRQRINLDRILREAITNILKHSHPQSVEFKIDCRSNLLCLILEDDGQISEPVTWKAHGGLYNMQSRAMEISARLTWKTFAPPEREITGTQLSIELDL